MDFLTNSPIHFINDVTPFQAHFVIFCAVWLPWITIAWVLIYLLIRPIPNKCVFAPFENIRARFLHLSIVCISAIGAVAASNAFKNYFQISRPDLLNLNLHPLLPLADYGFPSGHAAVFSAIAASLFLINHRAGAYATLLALIIGAARIFAGVHTPLDIIGGYVLGVFISIVVDFIAQKLSNDPIVEDTTWTTYELPPIGLS